MSANFYLSSHANNHLHPRAAVVAARQEDYKHATEQELAFIEIWSASGQSVSSCEYETPVPQCPTTDWCHAYEKQRCRKCANG